MNRYTRQHVCQHTGCTCTHMCVPTCRGVWVCVCLGAFERAKHLRHCVMLKISDTLQNISDSKTSLTLCAFERANHHIPHTKQNILTKTSLTPCQSTQDDRLNLPWSRAQAFPYTQNMAPPGPPQQVCERMFHENMYICKCVPSIHASETVHWCIVVYSVCPLYYASVHRLWCMYTYASVCPLYSLCISAPSRLWIPLSVHRLAFWHWFSGVCVCLCLCLCLCVACLFVYLSFPCLFLCLCLFIYLRVYMSVCVCSRRLSRRWCNVHQLHACNARHRYPLPRSSCTHCHNRKSTARLTASKPCHVDPPARLGT